MDFIPCLLFWMEIFMWKHILQEIVTLRCFIINKHSKLFRDGSFCFNSLSSAFLLHVLLPCFLSPKAIIVLDIQIWTSKRVSIKRNVPLLSHFQIHCLCSHPNSAYCFCNLGHSRNQQIEAALGELWRPHLFWQLFKWNLCIFWKLCHTFF